MMVRVSLANQEFIPVMLATARVLDIDLPKRQSAFLWGARKTGKSTYLHHRFPDSLSFDLLDSDLVIDLLRRPALLRERLLSQPAHLWPSR